MGEMRNAYKILVRKPEGMKPLRGPTCRWEDITRMDLREIESESVDWMHLVQDRNQLQAFLNTVMNPDIP
jgi:serine/threonine protein kinase HipA of HipAB toxin-antitoxin module